MKRWCVVLLVLMTVGCNQPAAPAPRLCADCAAIKTIQDKLELTAADRRKIDALKVKLADKEQARASVRKLMGEPPDLHPECECDCHKYWLRQ